MNDLSNSKLFWQFYYSYFKIKNDKSCNQNIFSIKSDSNIITNQFDKCKAFKTHFTSLKSSSTASLEECMNFTHLNMTKLVSNGKLSSNTFCFEKIDVDEVEYHLENLLSSTSPGSSGIPTLILKSSAKDLSSIITFLFNECLETGLIPDE
jgi:hypothetical protein